MSKHLQSPYLIEIYHQAYFRPKNVSAPNTWITDFKKVLHEYGGEVILEGSWTPTLQRKHDIALMEYFSAHIPDKETLQLLNNCRLYLQIFTLSDISSSDGTKLTKCALSGHRNPAFQTLLHWPKQKRPSNKTWKRFSHILRTHFCTPHSLQLTVPLGPWNKNSCTHVKWNHFLDQKTGWLYKHHNRVFHPWTYHRPVTTQKYIFNVSPGVPANPPPTLHRIAIDSTTKNSWIYCPPTNSPTQTINIQYESFQTTIKHHPTSPPRSSQVSHLYSIPPHLLPILKNQIKCGTTHHAIDGSVGISSITGSWVKKVGDIILKTGGKFNPGSGSPSSTRAERGAYLFLLQNIMDIYSTNTLQGGHHTIYVDNKQVIDYSTLPPISSGPSKFLLDDYDILEGIRYYTQQLTDAFKVSINTCHIYSHLNKKKKDKNITKSWTRNTEFTLEKYHSKTIK